MEGGASVSEAIPFIRHGVGGTPADGGCVMQIVDWIAHDGSWTDQPECVHPVFQRLAVRANDDLPDGERQKLLDLIPRLMNTNTGGRDMAVRLAVFCARSVLHVYEERRPGDPRPRNAIEATEAWLENPCEENRAAAAAAYAAAYAASSAASSASAHAASSAASAASAY